ncbi:hypothetical protein [Pseudomonas sp.]|uniref:hypothetical protein n=1 Tax=Pseudomonas sp. TaxID=306 RepID=UPI002FC706C4
MNLLNQLDKFRGWFIKKFPEQEQPPLLRKVAYYAIDYFFFIGVYTAVFALIFAFYTIPPVSIFSMFLAAVGLSVATKLYGDVGVQRLLDRTPSA